MKTLIQSLAEAIERAETPALRDEARISWASCAARYGRIDDARRVLDEVRAAHQDRATPRVTIALMVLESIILYYSTRDTISLDRIRRACLLSEALDQSDLAAGAASLAAHYAFNFGDHELLQKSLMTCFERYENLDEVGRARSALVLADGLQFTGDATTAQLWYQRARRHALTCHDHATVSAIEFNRLAIGLSRERAEYFATGRDRDRDGRRWATELESVRSFHAGVLNESLTELLGVCTILVHELMGEFALAADLLFEMKRGFSASVTRQSALSLEIEWRWCLHQAGDMAGPSWQTSDLDHVVLSQLEDDDRLACYGMLSDLVMEDQPEISKEIACYFDRARSAYWDRTADLSSRVQSVATIAQQYLKQEAS